MDLNGPGTSLFQGNDLNNFDNLAQREEEEEAIEEQRRRDLELKNMLENAFDDVSFDNDEGSLYNGSQNHSSIVHSIFQNNSHVELDPNVFKQVPQNRALSDLEKNGSGNHIENYNTPLKHSGKNNQIKRVDFSNDSENYSDQCRKKIQNGSLHDIVDASGGGGDADLQTSLHYNHCFQRSPLGEVVCNGMPNNVDNILKPQYTDNAHDSSEQIKILYDVRVREVHRLTELIDSVRNEHEIESKELKHQIALLLAEKERASISQSQLQSLLMTSKKEAEELLKNFKTLEQTNKDLENSKNELMIEFDTAKLTVDDLQRKLLVLEKGNKNKTELMQYELNLKSLTEKYNAEAMTLKRELDSCIKNYEALLKENEDLKLKISNLSQINDENLAKKSEIINRLSKQIEETQRQCENFMKSSTAEDNFRLQTELKMAKEEKTLLALKLENLEKENSKQEEELKQYESLSRISFFSGNFSDTKEFESSDVNGKLGAELYRALNSQKAKRQEIKNLQAQLNEKNQQITQMTENEKLFTNQVASLKEEVKKYLNEVKTRDNLLQSKEEEITNQKIVLDDLTKENSEKNKVEELEKENKILRDQIECLEKEKTEMISNYNEEYMRFHNEGLESVREETEKYYKLEILKKDLEIEDYKKEIEELKNMYVEVYNAKESLMAQMAKEKESSGRSSAVDLEEVKKLQKELEKSRHRILELDQTLKQQYQQEVEILNLDINQLNLQIEKIKKEKDRETTEKDKMTVENELLKSEIEQVTSEKNLLFLNCEKLEEEAEELRRNFQKVRENSKDELRQLIAKHESEMQSLSGKYEITIKKLKKEVELNLARNVKCESKYTSPIKSWSGIRSSFPAETLIFADKSTSPIRNAYTLEASTSPMSESKKSSRRGNIKEFLSSRDISVLTDPEPVKIPKKEVIEIMERLGAHHEEEMKTLENKYRAELARLDKKFQVEVDKAKEVIRRELQKEHMVELEEMEEKHRMELENRIEQEKKEAVVDLITEWACEVQGLKVSYAETQAEMERMKMKYKAAKSVALQYKTYFKSKTEHMKEEWKRIESGYERALKELEKNVHILVDVKEDEVKEKVSSITKIYEQKISKMKEKLSKCEDRLKAEKGSGSRRKGGESSRSAEKYDFKKELEKLTIPEGNLAHKKKKGGGSGQYGGTDDEELVLAFRRDSGKGSEGQRKKHAEEKPICREESSDKERTSR